jgi:hypothetical protein
MKHKFSATEKFTATEVATFRHELSKRDFDWLQTAEVITAFIVQHGYGVSPETALAAARRIEGVACNVDFLHSELETLALVM